MEKFLSCQVDAVVDDGTKFYCNASLTSKTDVEELDLPLNGAYVFDVDSENEAEQNLMSITDEYGFEIEENSLEPWFGEFVVNSVLSCSNDCNELETTVDQVVPQRPRAKLVPYSMESQLDDLSFQVITSYLSLICNYLLL